MSDVVLFEWAEAVVSETYRGARGERRLKAVGRLGGHVVALVFAPLGAEAISIISLRPASRKERRMHAER